MPEMVIHEETGLLANPKDARDFAKQIKRLINDPALRKKLGEQARQRSLEQFNAQTVYSKWEKVLTE